MNQLYISIPKKKNINEFLKQAKSDIKTASEKGRFSCILYYKIMF